MGRWPTKALLDPQAARRYSGAMVKAVFPGSFDPPTFGHLNVVERARGIFEELYVVVAVNHQKSSLFSPRERLDLLQELLAPYPNVSVHLCDTLIVEFARKNGCKVLVRGVRSVPDFSYEFEISILNKSLDPSIETFFMPTDPRYFVLRSSAIKELASFDGDLSGMVPPNVARALKTKVIGAESIS
jgi:pantetheine-phosphate adenylyltransferase